MTRINLVDPSQLTSKHLMAEYRELPRIFTSVRKLYESGKTIKDISIPEHYVLGQGHMKFFYNKLIWLQERFISLKEELDNRNYNIDMETFVSIVESMYLTVINRDCPDASLITELCEDYYPSPEEIYLNMSRLCKRSNIPEVLNEMASA